MSPALAAFGGGPLRPRAPYSLALLCQSTPRAAVDGHDGRLDRPWRSSAKGDREPAVLVLVETLPSSGPRPRRLSIRGTGYPSPAIASTGRDEDHPQPRARHDRRWCRRAIRFLTTPTGGVSKSDLGRSDVSKLIWTLLLVVAATSAVVTSLVSISGRPSPLPGSGVPPGARHFGRYSAKSWDALLGRRRRGAPLVPGDSPRRPFPVPIVYGVAPSLFESLCVHLFRSVNTVLHCIQSDSVAKIGCYIGRYSLAI
jgi:hypothetical protein